MVTGKLQSLAKRHLGPLSTVTGEPDHPVCLRSRTCQRLGIGLDSGRERGMEPAKFKNRAWQSYELSPATIPGHKTPQQPATKPHVKPKGTDKDKKPCHFRPSPVILLCMNQRISRRSALRKVTGGSVAIAAAGSLSHRLQAADEASAPALKGRIHHSVCRWCYGRSAR